MEKNKLKSNDKFIIMILIGFFAILFWQGISISMNLYPTYVQNFETAPQFQYYTLDTFFGVNYEAATEVMNFSGFKIPLISILGYVLIIIGFKKFKERSKVFALGKLMAYLAIAVQLFIFVAPFIVNGSRLAYVAMVLGIASVGLELSVGYFFLCALCDILTGTVFKTDRVYLVLTWFGTVILRIIVFIVTWLHLNPALVLVYNMLLLWMWVLFAYFVWKLRTFITGEIKIEE